MNSTGQKTLKSWIDRLKRENQALKEKLAFLRKENRLLQKDLRENRRLTKDIPGAIVLIQDGNIILCSDEVWQKLEYVEEEVLEKNFFDFVHPDSIEYIKSVYKKRLSGKSAPDRYETNVITKHGKALCCDVRVKKIRYQGRTAFLLNIMQIDHRKQMEKELCRSQKMEALVRMASGVSREFNDCLNILGGYTLNHENTLSNTDKNPNGYLEGIEAARQRVYSINQAMTTLARAKLDRSDTVLCDLNKIILDIVETTRPKWEGDSEERAFKINIKTYLRNLSPVEGHPEEIRDVFIGMISNAIDALSAGGEIYLTTEEDSGFAHVYIQDNGEGIPDEIRDKIFDPFFTTKDKTRMGLGLSLAYAVINEHKGEIEVISQEGQGTTFIIKIPLVTGNPLPKTRRVKKNIKDSHILIISVEGVINDILYQLLMNKGCNVVAVSSVTEGLKLLRKKYFDLVIINLNRIHLVSSRVIPRIKEMDQTLPIVLVGADKGEKLGADMVVDMPFEAARFLSLVSEALEVRESRA